MKLGERIYQLRTEKNLSQGDLADMLDVSRQSVSKWENDTAVPDLDKLIKLCDVFEISLDELVGRKKTQEKNPQSKLEKLKNSLTKTQQIGCALVAITLLSWIVPLGRFFTFSLGCCTIICLFIKKYAWYWCIWAVYLPIQISINYINTLSITYIMESVFIIVMSVIAFFCLKEINFKAKKKKVWAGLSITYSIAYIVFLCFAPQFYYSFDTSFGVFIGNLAFAIVNAVLTLILGAAIVYVISITRQWKRQKYQVFNKKD